MPANTLTRFGRYRDECAVNGGLTHCPDACFTPRGRQVVLSARTYCRQEETASAALPDGLALTFPRLPIRPGDEVDPVSRAAVGLAFDYPGLEIAHVSGPEECVLFVRG